MTAVLVCFTAACTKGEEPEPKSYSDCFSPVAGGPVAAEVAIGSGDAGSFQRFADGAEAELVLGSQGGYMIVPTVRVDALAFGLTGAGACIDLETSIAGRVISSPSFGVPPLSNIGGYYYVERLPLFLASELSEVEDESCNVKATLRDGAREATGEARVRLVDDI
jgi:hypothetical protein